MGWLRWSMVLCALAWTMPAQAQTIVLFERDADAAFATALRVELGVSGLVLDRVPAAMATEPSARTTLASDRGALAAVWVEDSPSAIAVAIVHGGAMHRTPVASEAEPRVRALVAASTIDDLLSAADDATILAEPTSVAPAPAPVGGYRMLGRLIEDLPVRPPLLGFYGQLSSGPALRASNRTEGPIAVRLDAGWNDRNGTRLGLTSLLLFDAFERTMPLTILFGITAGARFLAGSIPLTLGASITAGSGTIPTDPQRPNTTATAGVHFSAGIPVDGAFDLIARTDAALVVRQDTPAAFLGTLALGLDWH